MLSHGYGFSSPRLAGILRCAYTAYDGATAELPRGAGAAKDHVTCHAGFLGVILDGFQGFCERRWEFLGVVWEEIIGCDQKE